MSTIPTALGLESLTLIVTKEMHVQASVEDTFAALLEQLGPQNTTPEGVNMQMKLEAWPGGKWWRDLGDNNGHFWGNVQAIKRPTLLEFCGPLFMSYAVVSNVQYRLSEVGGGTLITFHHRAFGAISEDHRKGVTGGWAHMLEGARQRAEAKKR